MVGDSFSLVYWKSACVGQKIESRHFHLCPWQKFPPGSYHHPRQRDITHSPPDRIFYENISPLFMTLLTIALIKCCFLC